MKQVCVIGIAFLLCIFTFTFQYIFLPLILYELVAFKYICSVILATFVAIAIFSITAGNNVVSLSKDFPYQFRLVAQFRTPLLMFFVIPLSFLMWIHAKVRDCFRLYFMDDSISSHLYRLNIICRQIKDWNAAGRKTIMRTARPNWASMSTKLQSNKGDAHRIVTHDLTRILDVDYEEMTMTAEPAVSMGQITSYLVPKGYALLIQVEMESLTIGGLSMGFGMETNSHIAGFFQESVVAYELVTSEGEVVHVTAVTDPELFYALPWSCGTIGFLTAVTVKIIKVLHDKRLDLAPVHRLSCGPPLARCSTNTFLFLMTRHVHVHLFTCAYVHT